MSKQSHKVLKIILMVFVVTLARSQPCSAENPHEYGKPVVAPWSRGGRLMNSPVSNDPSALFDQLNKDTPVKDYTKWHKLIDMSHMETAQQLEKPQKNHFDRNDPVCQEQEDPQEQEQTLQMPLPQSVSVNYPQQEEQRERNWEHLQSEAADREFEQLMKKIKLNLPMRSETENDEDKTTIKPKSKVKSDQRKTTTVSSTVSTRTMCFTPPPTVSKSTMSMEINQPNEEFKPEEVENLLKTAMSLKKHAVIIIKNVNLLEMELLAKLPDSCAPSAPSDKHEFTDSTGTKDTSTEPVDEPVSNSKERLDKPRVPVPHNRTFYFGFPAHSVKESDLDLDAALKEQRKLEQRVREEYLNEMTQSQERRLLESKRKRARYEAAPAAAVRLEVMTTRSSSNIVENTKVNPKIPQSVAVTSLANKVKMYANRNHIDLACQPLYSWKIMKKYQSKRKTKSDCPIVSRRKSQPHRLQRQQRRQSRKRTIT